MGYYELHIKRVHTAYRRRMLAALGAIKNYFPSKGVHWTEPAGGYTLWVRIPGAAMDEASFQKLLIRRGVMVSPGSFYFQEPEKEIQFRLSISNVREPEIEEGIRRLGRALKEVLAKNKKK
jgi:2-aminoadipate transaminase